MSVTIRLAKVGKKNAPAFKIVVSNTRDKRNGRFLDVLGHFNPSVNPQTYSLDEDKYTSWVGKGALVSDAVEKLKSGNYTFAPYTRQNEKGSEPATPAPAAAENSEPAEAAAE